MSGIVNSIWFNGVMAAIFIALAFNLFGAYEIVLPWRLQSKLQVKSGSKIIMGFLMGLAGIFVSFSCTAPLVAGGLAGILTLSGKNPLYPILGMSAFGLGFALPYGVLMATAKSLPKPGEWMVTAKKGMGIAMILAAFWFLQNVIPRPEYFSLALAVTLLIMAPFVGAFRVLGKDSSVLDHLQRGVGVIVLLFGLAFFLQYLDRGGWLEAFKQKTPAGAPVTGKILWLNNLNEAEKIAAEQRRPILVDFRSNTCSICREMEASLFPKPDVVKAVMEQFVPVKLDLSGNSPHLKHAQEVGDAYNVQGQPTFLYLKPDGALLKFHAGGYSHDEFLQELSDVSEQYKKNP